MQYKEIFFISIFSVNETNARCTDISSFIQPGPHWSTSGLLPVFCLYKESCEELVCKGVISYFGNILQEVELLNQRINANVILIDMLAMALHSPSNHKTQEDRGRVRNVSVRDIPFLIFPTNNFSLVKLIYNCYADIVNSITHIAAQL